MYERQASFAQTYALKQLNLTEYTLHNNARANNRSRDRLFLQTILHETDCFCSRMKWDLYGQSDISVKNQIVKSKTCIVDVPHL